MAKTLTKLHVGLTGDASGLGKAFKESMGGLAELGRAAKEFGGKMAEWVGFGAALELGRMGMDKLVDSIKEGFETADKIEAATVAFTGLAGSVENANAVMLHLKALASGSIIPLDDLTGASRKLLAVGVGAEQLEPILKNLGDIAAGTGGSVGEMADMLVHAAAEGSVNERILKEMGKQGIPIIAELTRQFNTNAEGVKAMGKAGTISFADLQRALASLSGPGGRFAGLMEAQANTVGGLFSRLKTSSSFDFADIATQIEETFNFKGALNAAMASLPRIVAFIQNGISVIAPFVLDIANDVGAAISSMSNWIGQNWANIADFTGTALGQVYNIATSVFQGMSDAASAVWTGISDVWASAVNSVSAATDFLSGAVAGDTGAIGGSFAGMGTDIVSVLSSVSAFISNWQSGLTMVFSRIVAGISDIGAIVGDAFEKITGVDNDITDFFDRSAKKWEQEAAAANDNFVAAAAKSFEKQDKAAAKIKEVVGSIFTNGFKSAALKIPDIKPFAPIAFDAKLNQDSLALSITPEIKPAKLMRFNSGEAQLAQYNAGRNGSGESSANSLFGGSGVGALYGGGISTPHPANAPPMPPGQAGGDNSMAALLNEFKLIRQYITKWDSNPPLAAVSL